MAEQATESIRSAGKLRARVEMSVEKKEAQREEDRQHKQRAREAKRKRSSAITGAEGA